MSASQPQERSVVLLRGRVKAFECCDTAMPAIEPRDRRAADRRATDRRAEDRRAEDRSSGDLGSLLYRSIREVCHDMRQPIATVGALAEAALTNSDVPGDVARRLRHIVTEVQVLSDLTQQIVRTGLLARPVRPADLLAEAVDEVALTYSGVLRLSIEPQPPVIADPVALRRALGNALENATRAAGPQGAVVVGLVGDARWTIFEIGDSGPGFGAAPSGVASLGLGIADRLMRAHGGRVEIGRSDLGGALVRLLIPTRSLPSN